MLENHEKRRIPKLRNRLIAISDAKVGMVLTEPISLVSHGLLKLKMAKDSCLTAYCIDQLVLHGAEFISVVEPDPRTEEQILGEASLAVNRVREIFKYADMSHSTTLALYEQMLKYRSMT